MGVQLIVYGTFSTRYLHSAITRGYYIAAAFALFDRTLLKIADEEQGPRGDRNLDIDPR